MRLLPTGGKNSASCRVFQVFGPAEPISIGFLFSPDREVGLCVGRTVGTAHHAENEKSVRVSIREAIASLQTEQHAVTGFIDVVMDGGHGREKQPPVAPSDGGDATQGEASIEAESLVRCGLPLLCERNGRTHVFAVAPDAFGFEPLKLRVRKDR